MSLVGLDGQAYNFNFPVSAAPAPPASNTMSDSANIVASISTSNKFQFELPSPSAPSAASSSSSLLFSSQPVNLTSPGSGAKSPFAPSNPQRKPKDASVQLDFSEFDDEIANMEEAKRKELMESLQVNSMKIAQEKNGMAALPSQVGDSKLFHQMVLKQYGKVHNLDQDPKKAFHSRKAKQRDARRAKKAEDKADQMEAKSGGAMRKEKHKNRSKGVY